MGLKMPSLIKNDLLGQANYFAENPVKADQYAGKVRAKKKLVSTEYCVNKN